MRLRTCRAELALSAITLICAGLAIVPVEAQPGPIGPTSPEPPLSGEPGQPPPQRPPLQQPPTYQPPPQAQQPCPDPSACPGDPSTPVVSLQLRAPSSVAPGENVEYRICIKNVSQAAAHHVIVRNPIPKNTRFVRADPQPNETTDELIWQLGTMQGGACREILLVLQPTGGDIKNCARVQFEHGQCVCTRIASPALKLEKCGPTEAVLYDSLTYCLKVTNTGNGPATNVRVTDQLPAGLEHESRRSDLTWDLGTLAPGQTRCIEYQVVAKQTGKLCNKATASAAGGLNANADHCVNVGEAKLTLNKTGPAERFVTLPATYQLTVSNNGTVPLSNVVVNDPVPAGMTFVSASAGGRLVGNNVQWLIGNLGPNQSRTVDVELRAARAGRICNRATAQADRGLNAQAEACTDFQGVSALLIEVIDIDDPVEVGAQTRYVISVRNQGTDQATNVRINAEAPPEMSIVRVTGAADHVKEGQKVAYQPLTIPAGGQVRYEIFVLAQKPGDVRFNVEMTSDQLKAGPVHEQESTTIYRDVTDQAQPPPNGARLNPIDPGPAPPR